MGIGSALMIGGRPGVFLDRDGVLLEQVERDGRRVAITAIADYALMPGVKAGAAALRSAGLPLAVVTNQPDVATGRTTRANVDAIHRRLCDELSIDHLEACFHVDADACDCRKPKPGMLLSAAKRLGIDPKRSFMVGDRWRDVTAGAAAGCMTILVGDGYGERFPDVPDHTAPDFAGAAGLILKQLAASMEKA
jgi:D-glycero-D-manno-heptose 1,7-bisphosphate phosphatase